MKEIKETLHKTLEGTNTYGTNINKSLYKSEGSFFYRTLYEVQY